MGFAPRIPASMRRLAFNLFYRGCRVRVVVTPDEATYILQSGDSITVTHHGEELTLTVDKPVTRPIPPAPPREQPKQPAGREPTHRRALGYS